MVQNTFNPNPLEALIVLYCRVFLERVVLNCLTNKSVFALLVVDVFTIANLWLTTSKISACAEPKWLLCSMKLYYSDNLDTIAGPILEEKCVRVSDVAA